MAIPQILRTGSIQKLTWRSSTSSSATLANNTGVLLRPNGQTDTRNTRLKSRTVFIEPGTYGPRSESATGSALLKVQFVAVINKNIKVILHYQML